MLLDEERLTRVKLSIAAVIETTEDVPVLLALLAQEDWSPWLNRRLRTKYLLPCLVCQTPHKTGNGPLMGLCSDCKGKGWKREVNKVAIQRHRALQIGAPCTLTLSQWFGAMEYFHWRCAYCQRGGPLLIEHLLSLAQGGGTTRQNCLPACSACNGRKSDEHPDTFIQTCTTRARERIQTWQEESNGQGTIG